MKLRLFIALLTAGTIASSSVSAAQHSQSANSELVLLLQQLQAEVRQLRGEIETQQYRLQKLEKEQLDRYRDMDRRLSSLVLQQADPLAAPAPVAADPVTSNPVVETASPSVALGENRAASETNAPVSSSAAATQPVEKTVAGSPVEAEAPVAPAEPTVSDRVAYQQAFTLVRERKFDESVQAFEQFIQTYPSSDNLANAYYWIGEVKLAQQQLDSAKVAFETVVSQFVGHRKRPDALYKLGVVQDRLGDSAAQQSSFKQLLDEYPKSSAAGLARNYKPRS
ncbi:MULTISPECIES: tol-pal system protein YbgF [unclassified Marinobacterium]|uniref:tol-pal system protein YbgF n=1 Tax=unclassified Marinobacterium TaxID=2644139 RepID=UPI00156930E7|nr:MULTISPECIES: tol-pal system protein YbgF [unclassified Marinobacterium]NRP26721.1 tol-pal system protein YbgF [Marinobacterium sp. xm-d-420]NRP56448.1 tol-pal system protein YbgF [Marinobacterium sp. xm-d-510]NRP96763.1 tol-pal system protein YbgF [Marinobacterium sp. xm-a-127]